MFSLFGFGIRRKTVKKRHPRVYKRGKIYKIKNGDKSIRLPVSNPEEAFKLLSSKKIYTKARRKPSSLARNALIQSTGNKQLRDIIDNLIKLQLSDKLLQQQQFKQIQANDGRAQTNPSEQLKIEDGNDFRKKVRNIMDRNDLTQEEKQEQISQITKEKPMIPVEPEPVRDRVEERELTTKLMSGIARMNDNIDFLGDSSSISSVIEPIVMEYQDLDNADLRQLAEQSLSPLTDEEYANTINNRNLVQEFDSLVSLPPLLDRELQQARANKNIVNELDTAVLQQLRPNEEDKVGILPDLFADEEDKDEEFYDILGQGAALNDNGIGLYDKQISKIMKDEPRFIGTIARDEILDLIPLAKHATDAYGEFGFIMNLDTRKQDRFEHWIAIYCDPTNSKELCYYDPFGEKPMYKKVINDLQKLVSSLDLPYYIKFKYNNVVNQAMNSNRCGIHSILFLDKMFAGYPFKEATNYTVSQSEDLASKKERQLKKFGLV